MGPIPVSSMGTWSSGGGCRILFTEIKQSLLYSIKKIFNTIYIGQVKVKITLALTILAFEQLPQNLLKRF